jgi:uncharacterized protein
LKTKLLFGIVFLTFLSLNAQEIYTIQNVPNPKESDGGWVSDPNNYIDVAVKADINRLITEIENTSTAQIAVVILPSIGEEVPKNFAVDLFEKWGIGQAEKDNGLLILTVMDQRRTEFEVGYGLEPILTDALTYRIASQELVPYFRKGQFGLGLYSGVLRIKQVLDDPKVIEEIYDEGITYEKSSNYLWWWVFGYLAILAFFLYKYLTDLKMINQSKDDFYDKYIRLFSIKHWLYYIFFPIPFVLIRYLLVKKRLYKYRNHQRYSKINGQELFKKSERLDNLFLEEGQIVEEKIKSVDYDVWVTKDKSDILILPYHNMSTKYEKCPSCGYITYYLSHSKVIKRATTSSTGTRREVYECKNCNYKATTNIVIPKVQKTSTSNFSSSSFSSSSGSSGFGGSSFGGGSSGGGGSGISW